MSLQASGPRGPQFRRPIRSARAVGDVRESHGGRRLATGITIAAGIIVVAHLAHALAIAPTFPPGPGPWNAWLALATVVAIGALSRTSPAARAERIGRRNCGPRGPEACRLMASAPRA